VGRIVVGVLVRQADLDDWNTFLRDVGYASWEETGNPAYRLFLGQSSPD
jgi:threonine dehydratase